MEVQSSKFKVQKMCPKLITYRLLLITVFALFFAVVLRLGSPSPAYAACTPPGAGWTCTESWTPIYGTCTGEICRGFCPRASCERNLQDCVTCGGVCCHWKDCGVYHYTCITGWNYNCVCLPPPPEGCDGTPCPAGFDCISGSCVPTGGNGPGPGCPASCGSKSDCDPCGSGYECYGGSCAPQCQQTGSGTKCDPDQPNNNCPEGEVCCWGVQNCYQFCCGGGGHTPRNPDGWITLSPPVNDPSSYKYYDNNRLAKDFKGYFAPFFGTDLDWLCYFGFGASWEGWEACRWWEKYAKFWYNFSPSGTHYQNYGGNFIVAWHGEATVDSWPGDDTTTSIRFHAPANWLVRAVEFDYINHTLDNYGKNRTYFHVARYASTHFGDPRSSPIPATFDGDNGSILQGEGHKKIYMQPASGEFWVEFRIYPPGKGSVYYGPSNMALIYNIKLHLIKVDKIEEKTVEVIANVHEENFGYGELYHMHRLRFSNECDPAIGPQNNTTGGCCADGLCWSGWIILDAGGDEPTLDPESLWGYPWTLGNPTKTVWMHACTIHDTCTVFSDSIEYNPFGTVSGYIWNDLNNNDGTGRDPPSEPNYADTVDPSLTVSYSCPSGSGSVDTTDGNYTFSNVPAENCTVSIDAGDLDPGWSTTTSPSVGVPVTAGGTTTVNFGVWDNPDAWFQGCNADAYGLGVSVPVPYDSKGSCDRWFLGADPNDTAGGVVISGNSTLSCNGRCSERGLLPGWNSGNQTIDWPSSLSFSPPSDATTVSSADPTLQAGRSYIWNRSDIPAGTHKYLLGSLWAPAKGVAVLYVNGNLAINGKFLTDYSGTQGVVIVVDGNVTINRDSVGDPYDSKEGGEIDIDAVVIASGTITVTGNSTKNRLVVNGMLYGKGGISVTGTELEDNLYPRLQTIYNALYFDSSNPLRQNAIKWREIVP